MALLPKEPRQQKLMIAIALMGGAIYAAREYLWLPKHEAFAAREAYVDTLSQENNAARILAARGTDLEARNAVYERHLIELEKLVPQGEEVPRLLASISNEVRRAGITLAELAPEADTPEQYYTRKAWTIGVWGEYDAIGRFITSIASLPRIITPKDIELAPYAVPSGVPTDIANPVTARMRIELYVLPNATAQSTDSAAAPAVP